MRIVLPETGSHWYLPDGTAMHDVARAGGDGTRPANLRDARRLGLLPSVTNILSVLARPGFDAWRQEQTVLAAAALPRRLREDDADYAARVLSEMRRENRSAADTGTRLHHAIEEYARSGSVPSDPVLAALFAPVRTWFDRQVEDVLAIETAVTHPEWGFAGRIDMAVTLRSTGRPTLIDFKTQKTRLSKDGVFSPVCREEWPLQLEAYRQALAWHDPAFSSAETASVIIGSTEPVPVIEHLWDPLDAPARFRAFLAARRLWIFTRGYSPGRTASELL